MIRLLKDFVQFLFNPKPLGYSKHFIRNLIESFFFFFLLILILILISFVFEKLNLIESEIRVYNERIGVRDSTIISIFLVAIVEETAFRLPLTNFNMLYIRLSTSFLLSSIFSIVGGIFFDFHWDPYLITVCVGVIFFVISFKTELSISKDFLEKKFSVIFWILTLLFALIHTPLFLMEGLHVIDIFKSLLVLFISGVFLGYIRIRFGFLYVVVYHILYDYMTI